MHCVTWVSPQNFLQIDLKLIVKLIIDHNICIFNFVKTKSHTLIVSFNEVAITTLEIHHNCKMILSHGACTYVKFFIVDVIVLERITCSRCIIMVHVVMLEKIVRSSCSSCVHMLLRLSSMFDAMSLQYRRACLQYRNTCIS
jgi:hypothetical protein